ncbi:MAG: hypothetical protein FWC68_01435 [Oscillospiraceae bacterium]|nr:hypothetical protein [Oscillospiraceae bacterium]
MATYQVPRNLKGEGRILYIFSTKALILSAATGGIGMIVTSVMPLNIARVIVVLLFAGVGFAIGTFKIPDTNNNEITRKVGGEQIDGAILRWIRFKVKKNRLYLYKDTKEEQ